MGKKSRKKKKKKSKVNKIIPGPQPESNENEGEIVENTPERFYFEVGQSVVVREGVVEPDSGVDIGGWRGRIVEVIEAGVENPFITIAWDGITMMNIPLSYIQACREDDEDWSRLALYANEISPTPPRDDEKTAARVYREIVEKYGLDDFSDNEDDDDEEEEEEEEEDDDLDPENDDHYEDNRVLLTTMTGEPYQLARIYYDLHDIEEIQWIFSKLRCMSYDRRKDRWVWLFAWETKKLKFQNSYSDIPLLRRPIVLGSLFSETDDEMYMDVKSFDRVEAAVSFFSRHVPANVAEVREVELVNRLFENTDGETTPSFGDYFDNKRSNNKRERDDFAGAPAGSSFPEVERLPVDCREDGLSTLKTALTLRRNEAMDNWKGRMGITERELFEYLIEHMPPPPMKKRPRKRRWF